LAEILIQLTGCKKPIQYQPRSQATLVRNRIGCPEKAEKEIGFKSQIGLKDGLKRLIEWRSEHKVEVEARRKAVKI
jgi:UDP-glucose 4-epimerase